MPPKLFKKNKSIATWIRDVTFSSKEKTARLRFVDYNLVGMLTPYKDCIRNSHATPVPSMRYSYQRNYRAKLQPANSSNPTAASAVCEDLKEGYEFCCTHCHADPPEVNRPTATPDKIKIETDRLQNWFNSVRTRQDQKK